MPISPLKINIFKKFNHQWNRAIFTDPLVVEFFKNIDFQMTGPKKS